MKPKNLLLLLMFVITVVQLKAQGTLGKVTEHKITSKVNGRSYEIFVALPAKYTPSDTTRYPVLYVLDGNFMFPVMNDFQYLLNEIGEVKDVIVVGIGYPTKSIMGSTEYRTPDYTPTKDTAFENMLKREMKMDAGTGSADKFLQVLKSEIFPLIEQTYKTRDRGLAGHSFGALFGAYVLMQEPTLFNKYLLSSISMFWDNGVLLKMEQAFHNVGRRTVPADVFITVGSMETYMDMIPSMKKLTTALRARNYEGLVIEERVLPNESHASAFLTSFNQGLRFLYKK